MNVATLQCGLLAMAMIFLAAEPSGNTYIHAMYKFGHKYTNIQIRMSVYPYNCFCNILGALKECKFHTDYCAVDEVGLVCDCPEGSECNIKPTGFGTCVPTGMTHYACIIYEIIVCTH